MTEPLARVAGPPLLLPDTPAFEAATTVSSARSLAYDLRHGRITTEAIERADRLLAQGARLQFDPALGDLERASLSDAVTDLRRARDGARVPSTAPRAARPASPNITTRPASGPAAAQQRLRLAFERLPTDPVAAGLRTADALNFEQHPLGDAQAMTSQGVLAVARSAGLSEDRARASLDHVKACVARAVHGRVVRTAREALDEAAVNLQERGRADRFEPLWRDLQSPRRAELLELVRNCGAGEHAQRLEHALNNYDASPSDRARLKEQVRHVAGGALSAAAEGLRSLRDRIDRGELSFDRYGTAFRLFPGAVQRAAVELGVSRAHAQALADGKPVRGSLLEEAVSERIAATRSDREAMETWGKATAVVASIAASALTGGGTAALLLGAANVGGNSFVVASALEAEERTRQSYAADLTGRREVDEAAAYARREISGLVANAAVIGVSAVGGGALIERAAEHALGEGRAATLTAAALEELVEEGVEAAAEEAADR